MKKRGFSLLLALCLMVLLPSASFAKTTDPGVLPIVDEPITLTIGMPNPTAVEDVETNYATKFIEEQTGINLDFVLFPTTEAAQKLEIMISAGEKLPDMLWGFSLSDVAIYRYGTNGIFQDLTPYYENQSYWIKDIVENPQNAYDMLSVLKSPDGNIYSVGRLQEETHCEYTRKMFINKTWLEKLGLDMPETTDELYTVLKAFKEQDPNGNGIADEIPMAGGTGWNQNPIIYLMNAFIYANGGNNLNVENGKLSTAYTTEQWREGLRFVHKLIAEELLTPLAFTQDQNQLQQMIQNPDASIVGSFTAASVSALLSNYPNMYDYEGMGVITGPDGYGYSVYTPSLPVAQGHITMDCENPEAAFRLMDYLWSYDAATICRYGEKDVDWREAVEGDVAYLASIGRKPARTTLLDLGTLQNKWWNFQHPMALRYDTVDGQIDAGLELDAWRVLYSAVPKLVDRHPDEVVIKIVYTEEQIDEIADINTTINTYVLEAATRFVLGDLDIEKDWDAYLNELNAMGLERYLDVTQEAYDNFKIELN